MIQSDGTGSDMSRNPCLGRSFAATWNVKEVMNAGIGVKVSTAVIADLRRVVGFGTRSAAASNTSTETNMGTTSNANGDVRKS